jgi:hypothetical protein
VLLSPGKYRDVQEKLIAEIHRTFTWPAVVTVDGNIGTPEKTDFIHRDGSYIILIPDEDLKSFQVEFLGLVLGRDKFKRLWSSEARFVIAGANELSTSTQMDIFDFFSKLRIYNCIIVSQEHKVIEKGYSRPINFNDVDTGMKLGVYTWFPYQSSDSCTEVNVITLLDSWVISAQGYFTKNTDLFPRKIRNNLNGCPVKTIVIDGQDNFTTNYYNHTYSNGSVVSYIEGLEIDLLKVVLKQMNATFFHVPTPELDTKHLINYLVEVMITKKCDLLVGHVGVIYLGFSFFDSTNTYHITNIRWYVPCSDKYPRWSSVFRIFSVELWLVLIISIVIAAISTTLVGRYSCVSELQVYKTLTSSLTNVWAVILGVSVSTMPRTPSLRSLFFAWVCFSVAFSTVFQAFLTTFLIDSGYKTPIKNMDELFASGIKLVHPKSFSYLLENEDEVKALKIKRSRVNCPSNDICWDWAIYQKNVSLLLIDKVAEINYVLGDFIGENSEPLLCGLEDGVVYSYVQSMVMFHGDPLTIRVSEIIDHVVEAGLYNHWNSQRMHFLKLLSRKIAIVHPFDGYYSFNLYHTHPAFYLLMMGWCLSALCFMVEFMYKNVLCKKVLSC